jgi:hypothetical protein
MPLDPAILASEQYLGLPDDPARNDERLERTLAQAVSRCESYTGRTVQPIDPESPFLLALASAPVLTPGTVARVVRARTNLVRVPDLRRLLSVEVLDGASAGQIDAATVEPVTWGNALTAVWLRLPLALAPGGARVRVTGLFGMDPLPADLEDSLYTYAATRWHEAAAQFGETTRYEDGATLAFPRRLPTIVRGVWDEYKVPEPAINVIPLRGA